MPDRCPSDPRLREHALRARDVVGRHRLGARGERQRRCLTGQLGELGKQRTRELAQVAARDRRAAPVRQPETEPVVTRAGLALDQTRLREGSEQPRDSARMGCERTGELVDPARPGAVREHVQHGDRARDRRNGPPSLAHVIDHIRPRSRGTRARRRRTLSESTPCAIGIRARTSAAAERWRGRPGALAAEHERGRPGRASAGRARSNGARRQRHAGGSRQGGAAVEPVRPRLDAWPTASGAHGSHRRPGSTGGRAGRTSWGRAARHRARTPRRCGRSSRGSRDR